MGIVNLLLVPVWWVVIIVVHESAHAIAGKILGFKVFSISIGYGRPVAETRLLGIKLKLNLGLPGGETILATQASDWFRLRWWLAVFSGPASDLIVLLLIYYLVGRASIRESLRELLIQDKPSALAIVFLVNAVILLANLLPLRLRWSSRYPVADGYQLVTIPFLRESRIAEHRARYNVLEAIELIESGDVQCALRHCQEALSVSPGNAPAQVLLALVHMRLANWREARDILVELLHGQCADPRDEIKNNIAWSDLFLGDPALIEEADAYSQEALAASPGKVHFQGTRGAVLVCLGKLDEGIERLKAAYSRHGDRHSRACVALWLGIAEARRGNRAKAVEWVRLAEHEYPNHEMAAMAGAEVEAVEVADRAAPID
jgi:Flp pilus assembly protein TadD